MHKPYVNESKVTTLSNSMFACFGFIQHFMHILPHFFLIGTHAQEAFLNLNILEKLAFLCSLLIVNSCSEQDWKQDRKVIAHIWRWQICRGMGYSKMITVFGLYVPYISVNSMKSYFLKENFISQILHLCISLGKKS